LVKNAVACAGTPETQRNLRYEYSTPALHSAHSRPI
jgi:hypothetical protein